MSLATCNGTPVISADVRMSLRGPWTAHVDLDVDDFPEGPVVLTFEVGLESLSFYGTAKESASNEGRTRVYIVGGHGALRTQIAARSYTAGSAATIVRDLMFDTGERMASGVEELLRTIQLDGWHRAQGTGALALTTLCRRLGLQWRVLASGNIWIGTETWPQESDPPQEVSAPNESGHVMFAPDLPALRPGTNVNGRRVSEVRHVLSPTELRTYAVYLKDATSSADRGLSDFDAAVRGCVPELAWLATHDAEVVGQNADGTLQVRCDADEIGDRDDVPVFLGFPGARVTVAPGARVKIGWNAARPDQCFAGLWATDANLVSLVLSAEDVTIDADVIRLARGSKRVLCEGDQFTLAGVQSGVSATAVVATITSPPTDVPRVLA